MADFSRRLKYVVKGMTTTYVEPRFTAQVVDMSYSKRTVTVDWMLEIRAYNMASDGGMLQKSIGGVTLYANEEEKPFYSDTKYRDLTNSFVQIASGTKVLTYADGDDTMPLYITYTLKHGTIADEYTGYMGRSTSDPQGLLNLQDTPFIILPFWAAESGDVLGATGQYPYVYDTANTPFKICVPKTREDLVQVKFALIGDFDDYSAERIWEFAQTNLTEGLYDYDFHLTQKQRVYLSQRIKEVAGTGTPLDYFLSRLIREVHTLGGENNVTDYPIPISIQNNGWKFKIIISDTSPLVTGTVVDTNAVTQALTGDNTVLVRYWSNALATPQATAQGGATIVETGVTHLGITMENVSSYNFEKVESNSFEFYAVDDRGEIGYGTIETPFIPYVKLTAKLGVGVVTGTGEAEIKVSGGYYKGSFGAVDNELFVYYRYKLQGASDDTYTDWIQFNSAFESGTTYSATDTVTGLDYTKAYVFQAYAADALDTVQSADKLVISTPVFDWSATDFNFNVPVTIMGKVVGGANPILWQGNDVMHASSVAELAQPISEQTHGIVLVFSNESGNVSWNTFYVPKEMINIYDGGGHTFLMAVNAGLSSFGAKYLYISDESITGHATNQEAGVAASNIKFSNADYVLRYVIGV